MAIDYRHTMLWIFCNQIGVLSIGKDSYTMASTIATVIVVNAIVKIVIVLFSFVVVFYDVIILHNKAFVYTFY